MRVTAGRVSGIYLEATLGQPLDLEGVVLQGIINVTPSAGQNVRDIVADDLVLTLIADV